MCKVKGHATKDMVRREAARRADLVGNNQDDEAADFGRRRQDDRVATARRNCTQACHKWYAWLLHLHWFYIAVGRIAVNHDPCHGTALDPTVWSAGAPANRPRLQKARLQEAVREFAAAPGLDALGWRGRTQVHGVPLTDVDLHAWPYSTGFLVKFTAFWGSLHWLVGDGDLVMGGFSYAEVLILYELWAGERLVLETALP